MAEIINLNDYLGSEPDLDTMGAEELRAALQALRKQIAQLDEREPKDMASEEYEAWGDAHEELEDRVDEILERLDELR